MMQTERADQLKLQLEETEQKLKEQNIHISSLGSVAEAALQLNGVFEAAQHAADLYLKEAKKRADEEAASIIENAKKEAGSILAQAAANKEEPIS